MIPEKNRIEREQYLNKPLPSNKDAENYSIGGVLLNQQLVFQLVSFLKPDDYYSPLTRNIVKAMFALAERQSDINPLSISEELKRQGIDLESYGGIASIANLTYGLPHFSDLMEFINVVKDKSLLRQLIKLFNLLTTEALSEEYSAREILDKTEREIFAMRDSLETKRTEYQTTAEISIERIKELSEMKVKGQSTGLVTGLLDADAYTGGLQKGDLTITAGRPSHGKSSLILDQVYGVHEHLPEAVSVIFSCEMSKQLCSDRILCQAAKVNLQSYRNNNLFNPDWARIREAMEKLHEYKIIIIDESKITPMRMRYHLNRIADKYGRIDLGAADYVELMRDDKEHRERRDMLGAIAEESKAIAKDFGIPFDLASQLNRDCEKRNPPKPIESDLAGSDQLGRHADVIRFVYREWMYKPTGDNKELAELLYRKNRNGATGTAKVGFLPYCTHFRNLLVTE